MGMQGSAVFPAARDRMTFPELLKDGFEPHKVAEVWVMGHPEPDHYVDITENVNTAVNAIAAHVSQVDGRSADQMMERMQEWRRRIGVGKGMQYARSVLVQRRVGGRRVAGDPAGGGLLHLF